MAAGEWQLCPGKVCVQEKGTGLLRVHQAFLDLIVQFMRRTLMLEW